MHIANLLMSMLSSGQFDIRLDASSVVTRRMVDEKGNYKPNPCSFYLLNLAIDVSLCLPLRSPFLNLDLEKTNILG